jgi:small subunit ribosomal protein S13
MQFRKQRVRRTDTVRSVLLGTYGLGPSKATRVCQATGILPTAIMGTLTDEQLMDLTSEVESTCPYGLALRTELQDAARERGTIHLQRWVRQMNGLPTRGQRTKTNASTARRLNRHRRIK